MAKTFQEAFPKATMYLAIHKTLFAQLMYASQNLISEEVPTAATDFRRRYFNEEWMSLWDYERQCGVMAHEILHEILLHQHRRGDRDQQIWNIACDIKINNLLDESGFKLPAAGCFDYGGEKFIGALEEEIYDALMKEAEKNGGEGGGGVVPEGYEGDLIGDTPTAEEVALVKGKLQTAVDMHGMGSLPQELKDAIVNALNPKEKWYEWLRKYFTSKQYSGCDWTAVCRREYIRSGMVAPPFQSDSLGVVVISVDQSGSISAEELAYFAGHVNSILLDCRPSKVVIQYFDTRVHETEEFGPADLPIELRRVCGGGTSFVDCCAKAEEHEAVVHVVLTDMYGEFPADCSVPTIWASTSGVLTAPFGDVVSIKEE